MQIMTTNYKNKERWILFELNAYYMKTQITTLDNNMDCWFFKFNNTLKYFQVHTSKSPIDGADFA